MKDPLAKLPGYLMRRASAASFAEIAACLAPLGIRPTETSILTLVASNTGVTQSEVGWHLGIKSANMAPLIARMEEQGWIARERIDGRSQALVLTDAGKRLQELAWAEMRKYEGMLTASIPEEHRMHVLPVLMALWKHK